MGIMQYSKVYVMSVVVFEKMNAVCFFVINREKGRHLPPELINMRKLIN
jgi:hypothetical protein